MGDRPNDVNQLVPLGFIGELCIEGAIVGRGYLNDEEKTAAVFIEDQRGCYKAALAIRAAGAAYIRQAISCDTTRMEAWSSSDEKTPRSRSEASV